MDINTRYNYVEIGNSVNSDNTLNNSLSLPAPVAVPSSDEYMADAERSTDGVMILQEVGRTNYATELTWAKMKNTTYWAMNRWFRDFGHVFYLKYFSHTDGRIKINSFYRGNMQRANPSNTTEIIDGVCVPQYYTGCGFSIIDMGEQDITVVKEINLT